MDTAEAELVREARAGNTSAYEQLVRRWGPRVLAVCHARLGRADAAEDLSQESLLRGLRALPTLNEPEKFGSWICGIASRTCLDWLKAKSRSEVPMSTLAPDAAESVVARAASQSSTSFDRQEELARLMKEVEQLPPAYREVLMHYYYEDCTYDELAKQLGISAATVNARLTRARQLLRRRLDAPSGTK